LQKSTKDSLQLFFIALLLLPFFAEPRKRTKQMQSSAQAMLQTVKKSRGNCVKKISKRIRNILGNVWLRLQLHTYNFAYDKRKPPFFQRQI